MSEPKAARAEPALELRDLVAGYGRTDVISGLSLEVAAGEVYALIGRNGAGKTTLVASLLGLRPARRGAIRLFGLDPWRRRVTALAEVGFVPDAPDAPPDASVRQLAALCRALAPRWDGDAFGGRLERFRIDPRRPFGKLSRGQQGLVQLALALAPAPRLLVLDDPTLGFDAVARAAFYDELVGELADRGATVFLTTHDLGEVERIADRIGILHGGRLVAEGTADELRARGTAERRGSERSALESLLRELTETEAEVAS
ncbi:MAG: ABC transporter ATP-binding protein [Thermoanaerobaculia bacterium]|nr:ABC transporter ATP-binding protein [Thermoanaerobaculia bacterium]MCZ7649688.1 ABC transporter ATP-binding protein [Thermoanaerobaculia bacterium]